MIQTYSKAKQDGFTLVEIAIVLVIIGLLLGGILKGQELITSARVRNMADLNSSVQAAYYGFIDRYRQVPGDIAAGAGPGQAGRVIGPNVPGCPGACVGAGGGAGNGLINSGDWGEASAVWAHLAAAGFLTGGYQGGAAGAGTYIGGTIAPTNPYGGVLLLAQTADYDSNAATPVRLNLVLGAQTPVRVTQELDTKLDDGSPQTGVLRAAVPGPTGFAGPATLGATTCVNAGPPATWNVGNDDPNCNTVYLY
ncbi:MAG: prepilin-type N-terminal cleavage/methylation domain-containing protein [Gammaproteobacteria bacterium]